ncbi:serine hydrolase domain-containing protein [Actinomadura gamaensis]|uniref:Serine hydrolase domain-containing protein n=1 Tax=Actinomadura gamaensis TaxID=1763541 RepID=A0ABV9UA38_9ACTN
MFVQRVQGLRSSGRRVAGAVVAGGVMAGVLAPSVAGAAQGGDGVQRGLDAFVRVDGVPGAVATVTGRDGRTRVYGAGVGDLATGARMPKDGQVRIGSATKTFVAVVVLQLVEEGRVRLDEKVEKYLPGLLRGKGVDGNAITVRQLLQHTSGLPDFESDVTDDLLQRRYLAPRQTLAIALRHGAVFPPGTKWSYSNTNYLVAGMIVEKVARRSLGAELDRRVIRRAGLKHTYFPAAAETAIRGRHPEGYRKVGSDTALHDVTEIDPSAAWAAGAMVSTTSDLDRFYSLLLRPGRLLKKAQLRQMRTTVPIKGSTARYGLGLISWPLSCGGRYWSHSGSIPGFSTWAAATDDGRAATVALNVDPDSNEASWQRLARFADDALCR